jgi:hypothetical protein
MIDVTRWPCVIMAAPRTGSNVLAAQISASLEPLPWHIPHQPGLGHRCFYEPDEDANIWAVYQSAIAHSDPQFVVKIMSKQAHLYQDILNSNSYKIRLYRTDTIGQIASFYVADQRNIWYQRPGITYENYSVDIDLSRLAQVVTNIISSNDLLITNPASFDITLSYESLGAIDSAWKARTHAPDNIADLRTAIGDLLDQQRLPRFLHIPS